MNTGNKTTDKLIGVEFSGNIIHTTWYKTIAKPNGKADIIAINILADIVYWYRPVEVRNELTSQVIGYKKKFKADLLQKTYESYSELFGISKTQVIDAVKRLEELGVIKRIFRNIRTDQGTFLSNVLYLDLDAEVLGLLSFPGRCQEISRDLPRKKEGPPKKKDGTYTKSTSKIITNTNVKNKAIRPEVEQCVYVNNLSSEAKDVYRYFIDSYMRKMKKVHPSINKEAVDKLNSIVEYGFLYDPDTDIELAIDDKLLYIMIDAYFKTNYELRDGTYCDHRIWHFLSDAILKNLYYKECY